MNTDVMGPLWTSTRRTGRDDRKIRKGDQPIGFRRLELLSLDGPVSGRAENALEPSSGGSRAFLSESVL